MKLAIDAGVRDVERGRQMLRSGVANVVIALENVSGPEQVGQLVKEMPSDCLVFSLDLKDGRAMLPAGHTWPSHDPKDIALAVLRLGVRRLIILDLAAVGMNRGPARSVLDLSRDLRQADAGLVIVAGGGVRGPDDLKTLEAHGVSAALVASALHDGRLTARKPNLLTESTHRSHVPYV